MMGKIPGFGAARHGIDKVAGPMSFGSPRQPPDQSLQPQHRNHRDAPAAMPRQPAPGARPGPLHLSFNVPFSSNVAGPEPEDVIHATPGAVSRWTHPEAADRGGPVYSLPIHASHLENLRQLCDNMTTASEGRFKAFVNCSEPKAVPNLPLGSSLRSLVTNVCLAGEPETVKRMRCRILHETPISLVSSRVLSCELRLSNSLPTALRPGRY